MSHTGIDWGALPSQSAPAKAAPTGINWGDMPATEPAPVDPRAPQPGDKRSGFQRTMDNLVTRDPRREEWQSPAKNTADAFARGVAEPAVSLVSHPLQSAWGAIKSVGTALSKPGDFATNLIEPIVESGVKDFQENGPGYAIPHQVGGIVGQTALGELGGSAVKAAQPAARVVGEQLIQHAPTIGKVAGYGGTAAALASDAIKGRTPNLIDFVGATKPVQKTAEAAATGTGKVLRAVGGGKPLFDTSIPEPEIQSPTRVLPPTRQLNRGPIEMPPPESENGPIARTPQSQVVRGKGGRMTKQFLTGEAEEGQGTRYGNEPPLVQTFGEPKAPPRVINGVNVDEKPIPPTGQEVQPEPAKAAPSNYKDQVAQLVSEYQDLAKNSPEDPHVAQTLADYTDLLNTISQPGYKNPFIDVNTEAPQPDFSESRSPEVVPSPNGTATDTSPGVNTPTPIKVQRLPTAAKPEEPIIPSGPPEGILPGNYILHKPTSFYHGSEDVLVNSDIPSGQVHTAEDDLHEKGLVQGLRNRFDEDQLKADELGRQAFYKGNKVNIGKNSQSPYSPDVETLRPWAQTPWEERPLIDTGKKQKK